MSRFKRFSQSLFTGYALMGVNIVYTFLSLPLALQYLSKAEFGLWSLMSTVGTLAQMLDLGMSSSVARILVDHKDHRENGRYGATVKAGLLVGATQGAIALLIGASTIWFLADWLRVAPSLSGHFFWLIAGQIIVSALSFITRMSSQVLFAWQRLDLNNYAQMAQIVVGFVVLWVGFALHWGVYSFLASTIASWVASSGLCAYFCHRHGFWPRGREWHGGVREEFRHLFKYSADLFLMAMGVQLVMSTQVMLIQRSVGGEAGGEMVALWNVMTKIFAMSTQLILRFIGYTMPAFAEMMARREMNLFWSRYRSMFITVTMLATGAAIMLMAGNSLFVSVWTQRKFAWPVYNDLLLGVFLILSTQQCCHNSVIACLKEVREVKYTLFVEGIVFIVGSLFLLPRWGLTGMLVTSIACTVLFTWLNGTWRIALLVRENHQPPIWRWHMPVVWVFGLAVPCWLGLRFLLRQEPALLQLLLICPLLAVVGVWFSLRFALPADLTNELLGRLPAPVRGRLTRFAR